MNLMILKLLSKNMGNKMKKIILIVGASGVGKDSLIKSIKDKIEANFVQRFITRKPDSNELNYYVDKKAFETLNEDNFFISTWNAHGNSYGIAYSHIKDGLNIISISRSSIRDFESFYENVTTINITVPRDVLFERLKNRNRETSEEIEKRLNRSYSKIMAKNLIDFDNSQSIEESSKKLIEILENI